MAKAVAFFKYTGAVIVFVISYLICSALAHIAIQIINIDAKGFLIDVLPFFAAFLAGGISVYGALFVVERLFSTVHLRKVAWVFICVLGLIWIGPVIGLFLGVVGILDFPIEDHVLMSTDSASQALQSLVAAITVWKLT